MIGRYGGCFEEEYIGLCVGEQSPPTGFGCTGEVCTNSQCEKREMHSTEEASKYGWWKCQETATQTHELKDYSKQIILQGTMQSLQEGPWQ